MNLAGTQGPTLCWKIWNLKVGPQKIHRRLGVPHPGDIRIIYSNRRPLVHFDRPHQASVVVKDLTVVLLDLKVVVVVVLVVVLLELLTMRKASWRRCDEPFEIDHEIPVQPMVLEDVSNICPKKKTHPNVGK